MYHKAKTFHNKGRLENRTRHCRTAHTVVCGRSDGTLRQDAA